MYHTIRGRTKLPTTRIKFQSVVTLRMLRAESAELLWKATDEALISFLCLHNPRFLFLQDRKVQFRACRLVSDPKASAQKTLSTTPP